MNTRQTSEINDIPNFNWIACFFKFLCKHLITGKPTKSRRRDHDLDAATVKNGFQGTKMVDNLGGSIYIYVYTCVHKSKYTNTHTYVCIHICIRMVSCRISTINRK